MLWRFLRQAQIRAGKLAMRLAARVCRRAQPCPSGWGAPDRQHIRRLSFRGAAGWFLVLQGGRRAMRRVIADLTGIGGRPQRIADGLAET